MSDLQFYPTPITLARMAHSKFKNKCITRLLEPSAGRGNLLVPFGDYKKKNFDCIELDLGNQAILREKKFNVIDADFMQFDGVAMYSHIIMNPPFNNGAEHVIKAWSLIASGELVAIVNAETIKNPFSSARKLLSKLIADYGTVEFIEEAFTEPDTLRKTSVEVALVHLEKTIDLKHTFTNNLVEDEGEVFSLAEKQELAIKSSTITNAVIVFNTAVSALKTFVAAEQEFTYYSALLGKAMNEINTTEPLSCTELQGCFNTQYETLKNKAWNNILQSTEFRKHLSGKAYTQLVNDFEDVCKLSFTENNIRGFLLGLVEQKSAMNMDMLLDCFDKITKYIPQNRAYYRGWKSNLKHKDQAYRVKMTRFILPRMSNEFGQLSYNARLQLEDFDKTFLMLSGKGEFTTSLYSAFTNNFKELINGERISTDYFDIRYYGGTGTIHFFPTNKDVIDRFNLLVGRERKWLPAEGDTVTDVFWKQYDAAEKITGSMQVKMNADLTNDAQLYIDAHAAACEKHKLNISNLLN